MHLKTALTQECTPATNHSTQIDSRRVKGSTGNRLKGLMTPAKAEQQAGVF